MIPDIFLDRQLISLVARVAAFIMHFFLGGMNTASVSPRGRVSHAPKTRAREENPGREIEETRGGVMCTLKRKLKLRGSLLNRCKRPVNGGIRRLKPNRSVRRAATWLLRRNRSSPIRANFFDFKHRA